MINVTRLCCDTSQPADALRYGRGHGAPRTASERRPVVVWNITRRCNLQCVHCYSDSAACNYPGELDLDECHAVLDDLADFGVPAVLLSGGEPTLHTHFLEICRYATNLGLRVTISTNGTRINLSMARSLKALGVTYVGISLDGIGKAHDIFRGRAGTFSKVVNAFRNCRKVGQKAGLRLTLTPFTANQLPEILHFIEKENIERVCFYHLVSSGRGADLVSLNPAVTRACLRLIARRVRQWHARGQTREVLTVDQPADGPFYWLMAREEFPDRVDEIRDLIGWNGGGANSSGVGIGNIDSQGNVHADQFWQSHPLGNVRDRRFSDIWRNCDDDLLLGLRDRIPRLTGRCGDCGFVSACGGGFRVRAQQAFDDPWAEDPGCHLRDEEICEGFAA